MKNVVGWVVVFACIALTLHLIMYQYASLSVIQQYADYLYTFVQNYYLLSAITMIFLCALGSFFCVPVTVLLNVVSGFLFGVWLGALYSIMGVVVGGALLVVGIRFFSRNIAARERSHQAQVVSNELNKYGAYYIALTQLFPFTPSCLLNSLVGFTRISIWAYSWSTALGLMPGTLVYAYAGQKLRTLTEISDIMNHQVIIYFFVGSLILSMAFIFFRLRTRC